MPAKEVVYPFGDTYNGTYSAKLSFQQILLLLRTLGAVLGTGLHTTLNTLGIQSTADDVVTHTGQVLDTAASDQNNGVLLQV